jgi:diguanylate cyclase (GGDEF)-like protein
MAWSIFDLLTACFLFARFYVSGRPVFGWVGASYGLSGLLTLSYLAAYLGLLGTADQTVGDQQIEAALYIAWHVLFAVLVPMGTLCETKRHMRLSRDRVPSIVKAAVAGVVVLAAAITAAIWVFRNDLPVFALNGVMEPVLADAMQFVVALSGVALAAVVILCRERLYGLPLWLCVALLTSLLEARLNAESLALFSVAWDVGKVLTLTTSSIVMIQSLVTVLRMYASISEIVALRAHDAGARLRAIWRIATSEELGERDHLQLVLDVATSHIRSRNNVYGLVSRLENDWVRVIAVSPYGSKDAHERARAVYGDGMTIPLGEDVHTELAELGKTTVWQTPSAIPSGISKSAAWQAAIGTPIYTGTQTYFLIFGSPDAFRGENFVESDVAFVEVAASIINRRFNESMHLERIQYQTEHDPLTGAFNRTQFHRLGRAASAAETLRAVILIDLDTFSDVNYRHGQMIGDETMIEVASSLAGVDHRDVIARMSGDEFGVLVHAVEGHDRDVRKAVDEYDQLFHRAFGTSERDANVKVAITASIGVAIVDDPTLAFEALFARAAVALEHSKSLGGNAATIFGPGLQTLFDERTVERTELIEAIAGDQLFLEYQPTFELNTRTTNGAEALVRWNHPTRGVLRPVTLLPAIKRANLLGELTYWVMRQVARDFGGVELPRGFRCFFNVPSQALESAAFINNLNQVLFTHPELAEHLGIEVTESEVMHKVEHAIETLSRARQLGLMVAVDDFGTGYSSLNYLKRLPVDVLKLDKSFIDGLPDDPKDVGLAELFLSLSKQLGFVSLGEGIETEAQAEWLARHGCMLGQGFLYSRPIAFDALMRLVESDRFRAVG